MEIPLFSFITLCVMIAGLLGWCLYLLNTSDGSSKKDTVIMIDESNRWSMLKEDLRAKTRFTVGNKTYFLKEDSSMLNAKGRSLWVFSKNKPSPMEIQYDQSKWISSEALMGAINNELIKQMVKTTDNFTDALLKFGAIGGVVAGLSTVVILLNQLGVLNLGAT